MSSPAAINICVGGHDGTVAALSLCTEDDGLLSLEAQFAQETHIGAVRSMCVKANTLVTGGADETIHVYDIARRRERGTLFAHKADVRAVELFSDTKGHTHAVTGDANGAMCVWQSRDWRLLKTLHAHNAGLLSLGVHPSARLALSTSADRAVLMWDLMRGKAVFSAKTKGSPATRAIWDDVGNTYVLAAGKVVTINSVEGKKTLTLQHDKPVGDVAFVGDPAQDGIATGCEDGVVRLWDSRAAKVQRTGPSHEKRIVGVNVVDGLIVSGDVRGGLKIWDLRGGDEARLETCVGGGDMLVTGMSADIAGKPCTDDKIDNTTMEPVPSVTGRNVELEEKNADDAPLNVRKPVVKQRRKRRRQPQTKLRSKSKPS